MGRVVAEAAEDRTESKCPVCRREHWTPNNVEFVAVAPRLTPPRAVRIERGVPITPPEPEREPDVSLVIQVVTRGLDALCRDLGETVDMAGLTYIRGLFVTALVIGSALRAASMEAWVTLSVGELLNLFFIGIRLLDACLLARAAPRFQMGEP